MGREGRGEPLSAFIEKSARGCAATVAFVWEKGDLVNLTLGPTVNLRLRDTAHAGVHVEGIPKPCRLLSEEKVESPNVKVYYSSTSIQGV